MAASTTIRLPDELHRWATIAAYDAGVSLNGLVIRLLEAAKARAEQPTEYTEEDHEAAFEKGWAKVEAAVIARRKGGE